MDMSAIEPTIEPGKPFGPTEEVHSKSIQISEVLFEKLFKIFEMYDLDDSGTINAYDEVKKITTTFNYNLNVDGPTVDEQLSRWTPPENPEDDELEHNPWTFGRYVAWFFDTVMDPHYEYDPEDDENNEGDWRAHYEWISVPVEETKSAASPTIVTNLKVQDALESPRQSMSPRVGAPPEGQAALGDVVVLRKSGHLHGLSTQDTCTVTLLNKFGYYRLKRLSDGEEFSYFQAQDLQVVNSESQTNLDLGVSVNQVNTNTSGQTKAAPINSKGSGDKTAEDMQKLRQEVEEQRLRKQKSDQQLADARKQIADLEAAAAAAQTSHEQVKRTAQAEPVEIPSPVVTDAAKETPTLGTQQQEKPKASVSGIPNVRQKGCCSSDAEECSLM